MSYTCLSANARDFVLSKYLVQLSQEERARLFAYEGRVVDSWHFAERVRETFAYSVSVHTVHWAINALLRERWPMRASRPRRFFGRDVLGTSHSVKR